MIIKPLIGVDSIILGSTRDEIKNLLGAPTKSSKDKDGKVTFDIWEYDKLGLELQFSSDDDYRLGMITVENKEATLDGHKIVGLGEAEFLRLAKNMGLELEPDDELGELGIIYYDCHDIGVSFCVDNDIVDSVDIAPDYDESGDVPLWPARR